MEKKEIVLEQIEILTDLCIINKRTTKKKEEVFNILMNYSNEWEIQRKLRDLKTGNKTVDQFIAQYKEGLVC